LDDSAAAAGGVIVDAAIPAAAAAGLERRRHEPGFCTGPLHALDSSQAPGSESRCLLITPFMKRQRGRQRA